MSNGPGQLHKELNNGDSLFQKIGEEMNWEMMERPAQTKEAHAVITM